MRQLVGIRADATERIGLGHATRCGAIAESLERLGYDVVFLVSSGESADVFANRGYKCRILGGDAMRFTSDDALLLFARCKEEGICFLLFDTYGITFEFMEAWVKLSGLSIRTALIDDMFTYPTGLQSDIRKYAVDVLIGGDIFFDEDAYKEIYADTPTDLLIGPDYIPMRSDLPIEDSSTSDSVSDILITTGSTNPQRTLEWMSELAKSASCGKGMRIHVVVGPKADFQGDTDGLCIHEGEPIVDIMRCCQVAFSAAGITLLELIAMGIPTLALEMVENQHATVENFKRTGLGMGCARRDADEKVKEQLERLLRERTLRAGYAQKCSSLIDGEGAMRVARSIVGLPV